MNFSSGDIHATISISSKANSSSFQLKHGLLFTICSLLYDVKVCFCSHCKTESPKLSLLILVADGDGVQKLSENCDLVSFSSASTELVLVSLASCLA